MRLFYSFFSEHLRVIRAIEFLPEEHCLISQLLFLQMIGSPDSGTLLVSGASPDDVGTVGCGRFDYYHCGECSEDEESPNRWDGIDVGDGDEEEVDFYDAVSKLGCDCGGDDSGGDGDSGDGITWPPPLPPAPTASWLQRMRRKEEGRTEIEEPISVTMTN
jgi:hypothetical protein